jgi:hypothetical protein
MRSLVVSAVGLLAALPWYLPLKASSTSFLQMTSEPAALCLWGLMLFVVASELKRLGTRARRRQSPQPFSGVRNEASVAVR